MCKSKKCTKCGEIKPLDEFHRNKTGKFGRHARCKECINKAAREKKYDLTCGNENCKKPFKGNERTTKYCLDCRPQTRTFEECHEIALKHDTPKEFKDNDYATYQYATNHGWLGEIQSHMVFSRISKSDGELKTEMRKWQSRVGFRDGNSGDYQQAKKKPWYKDYCQEIYGDPHTGGWGRSDFIRACDRRFSEDRGNGLGLIYIIKCFKNEEWFYKIGITSQGSVKARYNGNDGSKPNSELNYYYTVLWAEEGPPGLMWGVELLIKQQTTNIRHQPEFWGKRSMETFKCHGNNKILRKPDFNQTVLRRTPQ